MKLEGKVALITGGASGIGKVTAKKFLQEGAKVVISDFNEEAGNNTLNEFNNDEHIVFIHADVSDTKQIEYMFQKTISTFGKIDILINNAGITIDGLLTKMDEDAWEKVIS
ncbi:SDR family NAD(P)-dependent oxidoreductase [Bacillus aerolatus]|uniref:SDR family NAD(P)-dependent oxidoreductase n=1 Tax=Bacillus aerolatus TaxID=2653354 RepID=A0A6I1FPQ2_9BACI|nr:SDR family NAD(P)-dependent oxidoreductase [Bacillus aerolatus]KAB7706270.1 SDR family NAD(P)-dependent oxidoreductase [Bacillus aerolatus]